MIGNVREFAAPFMPYVRQFPRLVSGTVSIGALSALAEGIGVSLFIPLLSGLGDQSPVQGGNFVRRLNGVFAGVPAEHRVSTIAGCLLAVIVLRSALQYGTQALYSLLDARVGHYLRSNIFKQCLDVEFSYWERTPTDKLLSTLGTETWRASHALDTLLSLAITLSTLMVYVAVLLLISWPLTLLVAVALLAISVLARLLTRRLVGLGRLATHANTVLTKRTIETFEGMNVIRVFGREDYEKRRFDKASSRVSRVFLRMNLMKGSIGPVLELCVGVLVVALLVFAVSFADNLPALLVFLLILYRLQPKVRAANEILVTLDTLRAPVAAIAEVLSREDKSYMTSGPVPCRGLRGGIRFECVGFEYPGAERAALEGVSAVLPFGQTTALVGPSGSGKSTFVKLLIRLYDPSSGQIFFDDEPLRVFELQSLRKRVAIVSQNVYLFETSIRRNIAYGHPEASYEAIVEAAKQADAHEFISTLPQGYETRVGSRGVRLSGGQQQRITLARAILAQPGVLILDEATNALDSMSEGVVQRALHAMRGKCAIVIVAHRLATIEQADNIIVLDRGQVREQGSFQELLRRNGLFARLYELQFRDPAAAAQPLQ
ncbi:MAG TPA: ABC transporter ATP-binding protein [Polyangiaceae bacterium]|nr:ABC transporter ATP-binding protein [Polyangiaceae bacterium]